MGRKEEKHYTQSREWKFRERIVEAIWATRPENQWLIAKRQNWPFRGQIRIKWRERSGHYKSVDWILKIINSTYKGKCIDSRIKNNFTKKRNRHLPDILDYLITNALKYPDCYKLINKPGTANSKIKLVTMKIREEKKLIDKKRIPVLVKVDAYVIAKLLKISEPLVWKYLLSMERAGLIQRSGKESKNKPTGAYRVIGGFVGPKNIYDPKKDEWEPVFAYPTYFWSISQPKIKEKLERFNRIN